MTDGGAEHYAVIASLIETCKLTTRSARALAGTCQPGLPVPLGRRGGSGGGTGPDLARGRMM